MLWTPFCSLCPGLSPCNHQFICCFTSFPLSTELLPLSLVYPCRTPSCDLHIHLQLLLHLSDALYSNCRHTLVYCTSQILLFFFFFFYKLKVCVNRRAASLSVSFFQQRLLCCVSVSHFGNSCTISNFFIVIIFVMVICDQ